MGRRACSTRLCRQVSPIRLDYLASLTCHGCEVCRVRLGLSPKCLGCRAYLTRVGHQAR